MPRNLYTVTAKSHGETTAHCIIREQYLRHVIADPGTRDVFAFWGEHHGIDRTVERFAGVLDIVGHDTPLDSLPPSTIDLLCDCQIELDRRLVESLRARAEFLRTWIVVDLFVADAPAMVPMRAWLASDLLTVFEEEVRAHARGDTCRLEISRPPTLTPVSKGQRPKGDGGHLRRWATWLYRAKNARPRATLDALAAEYFETLQERREPRDRRRGFDERPDTKLVRHGIAEAERLLSLPIPPGLWTEFRTIH